MVPLLFMIGALSATVGSLIGAGGGFILIPFLIVLFPDESPGVIGGMSLSMALTNSAVASLAYGRQKRIQYRWGGALAAGSVAGGAGGALTIQHLSRAEYEGLFGLALIGVAIYLLLRPVPRSLSRGENAPALAPPIWPIPVLALGAGIGFMAGLLGIGGGIMLVPTMVHLFAFAPHIATATSQFTIIFTGLSALAVRAVVLDLGGVLREISSLVAGAIVGGWLGPPLSRRISGLWLMRVLALALILVGIRLAMSLLR